MNAQRNLDWTRTVCAEAFCRRSAALRHDANTSCLATSHRIAVSRGFGFPKSFGHGAHFVIVAALAMCGCGEQTITDNGVLSVFGEVGFGPGEFSYPRAAEIGPGGDIYVVDKTARIQRFSPDGAFKSFFQMPDWKAGKPTGFALHPDGRFFVADTHYSRIIVFDADGNELERFGRHGKGDGEFILPTDVAIDDAGHIFVAEYNGNDRISRFSPDWRFELAFGHRDDGDAALARPSSIVFDDEQTLWVADTVNHRICRFNRDGRLLSHFGTMGREPGHLRYPRCVAICPDGTLLVTEYGNNRLQRFDTSGRSLQVWGRAGREPGELNGPWAAVVGADERVYVVDSLNNRMQIVRL